MWQRQEGQPTATLRAAATRVHTPLLSPSNASCIPMHAPCLPSCLQQGALAYGLKVDDRVRVLPNAKLRMSRE